METIDVRGTPLWQVQEYLKQQGGTEEPDGSWTGPGWHVTLTEGEHKALGTVHPRVIIRIDGVNALDLMQKLRLRVMRVGG